jgi:hypothetical protein
MDLNTTFLKGRMNKSLDERVLPDGEYIDALNIRIGSTENNSVGAIENSLGNTKIVSILYEGQELSTDARCIGAYEDSQHETIYWFVTDPGNVDMVLSYNERTGTLIYHVISTTVLNFSTEFLINGIDLIDNLLFWTDNYNPPRKINVNIPYLYPTLGIDNITDDDISVIVQPPIEAPEISPFIISGDENYMSERFISFSYRYKYRDGEYSALSQFSDIAFEPESFFVDYTTYTNGSMVNVFNSYNISFNTGGKNVVGIDVCFKLSDSSIVNIIEKFDKLDNGWEDNQIKSIQFDNKKIYTVLPNSELTRLFDNVPLTAKSQTTMGNRLIYGNYVDGYDIDTVIDYTLSAESEDNLEEEIVVRPLPGQYTLGGSRTIVDTIIELDFTGVDITNGSILSIQFSLFHNDFAGDPTYESAGILNSYEETFNFNITQDYANAYALANDPFFIEKIYVHKPITECAEGFSLTDDFNCSLTTIQTSPPEWDVNGTGITSIDQGFTIISSPSQPNIIKIQIPAIKFSGTDDPNPVLYAYEYLSDTGTTAVLSKLNSKRSLHSNRDYEVGIVYQDKYLRSTTALVCNNNTVFFPASTSDKKNYIVATINNLAPSWAERYKFVVKPSRSKYETLYTNLFFQDGNGFSWFKLEGENISKARVGERLVVKRDSNGALEVLTTIDILDVQAQSNNFISGPNTSNIINEPSGVYMKIRASNFEAIYEKESFVSIEGTNKTPRNYQAAGWNLSYVNPDFIPANPVSSTNQQFIPHNIPAGSLIKFDIGMNRNHRGSKCGGRTYKFQKTIVASQDYDNFYLFCQGEGIDFEKGVVTSRDNTVNTNEYDRSLSVPYKRTGTGSPINPIVYPLFPAEASVNKFQFFRQYLNPDSPTVPTGGLFFLARSGTPSCDGPDYKGSDTFGTITIQKATGLFVFETESLDADGEIYYEGSDSFPIVNGYHMSGDAPGDTDQTSTDPAIVTLNFFDCFSFANGVESYKINDSIVGAPFYLGERVTAVAQEDYMSSDRYATITYSGIYNAETNINKLNEFNLSLANFKDLEKSFGPINRLYARRTDILVLQEDKISYVLAGKNLLSDSAGGGNIASIPEVIGTQIARIEDYGISNNPESFAVFGGEVYFTDIKRNSVLNLRGGSAQSDALSVVSDMGMKYWFRDEFKNSQNYFKIGGYDPYMDEYVLHLTETAMPTELDVYGCGVTISKQNVSGTYEFDVEIGDEIGEVTVSLTLFEGEVDITVEYDDGVIWNDNLDEPDDYTFVFQKTEALPNVIRITITSINASYSTSTSCVNIVDSITVYRVVYNNPGNEDQTIHNQYKWSLGSYSSPLSTDFIIMEEDGVSLYASQSGGLSQGIIPANESDITLVSDKRAGDTFNFDPAFNSFKYLISNNLYTPSELLPLLTKIIPTTGTYQAVISKVVLTGFNYLYLVWDYRSLLEIELCYHESNPLSLCCDACSTGSYYIDSDSFDSATSVWLDELQTELAPDGLYLLDGTYRQLLSGVLLDPTPCPGCGCTCYILSSIGSTEFDYIDCFTNEPASITVFTETPVQICAKTGSVTEGAGDPGTIDVSEIDCCGIIDCECYTVTYVEPSGAVTGITEFSYFNCEGVLVNSEVGDGESAPTSLDVCAQEGTITLTGGDESATWAATTGVNCCVSFFPSFISGTPDPTDGCDATLDTPCWVSNINTSTPGQEIATSSSVVYLNPSGTVLFPGTTGEYKIKITGSSVCTSNAVASNGDVTPLEGLCFSCE